MVMLIFEPCDQVLSHFTGLTTMTHIYTVSEFQSRFSITDG
jgi:hypothetical protein